MMSPSLPRPEGPTPQRFAYFMVRLQNGAYDPAAPLAGLVERIGSGEKRPFQTGTELVRLLAAWRPAAAGDPASTPEEKGKS